MKDEELSELDIALAVNLYNRLKRAGIRHSGFVISIDDGFCEHSYYLDAPSDRSIQSIIDIMAAIFNTKAVKIGETKRSNDNTTPAVSLKPPVA